MVASETLGEFRYGINQILLAGFRLTQDSAISRA